ncbi:hypothetical protein BOTBODRAFT_238268 [Botryobasidium botryosum FD-172 SS1]|uniref:Uncharacterized protein n=1 Tax=Botryobasidium botryosum (strain FD-172 SS1) TaxID=930990 RepID=A0A067MMB0_BOTB1|nr:hypothetical protein BOTBODRAFT_238268 [Botryobasidium botryosum FD-172 SS1]
MIPFTISPPSPCRIVLLDLLRAYCNVYPPLRELISFIHLWAQSHQLAGITPLCLSLMTIAYLQAKDYIPNLQDPEVGGEEILQNGVWKREEKTEDGNTRVASVWCQTGFGDGAGWQTARFDVADVLAGWFQCVFSTTPLSR